MTRLCCARKTFLIFYRAIALREPFCEYFHPDTEGNHNELLLSLNRDLLSSLATQGGLPNPSVHIALRLSSHHNLAMENEHLNSLKTNLHNDLQRCLNSLCDCVTLVETDYSLMSISLVPLSSLSNSQAVTGLLALYTLALKSSCYDLSTVSFTVGEKSETLLTHLKRQMEREKDHITCEFCVRQPP